MSNNDQARKGMARYGQVWLGSAMQGKDMIDQRQMLLKQMQDHIIKLVSSGRLTNGKRIQIHAAGIVNGPRAGSCELEVGLLASDLLKALDEPTTRQLIPWKFAGVPVAYIPPESRCVRIEAGWPPDLAVSDIPFRRLGDHPRGGGTFIVGVNETGRTVTTAFDDSKPTLLVAGHQGSGKSWAIRSIVAQTSGAAWGIKSGTRLVLIDGKRGEGLDPVAKMPGVVGPLALDPLSGSKALAWTLNQMNERLDDGFTRLTPAQKEAEGRILVIIDEVQEFARDAAFIALLSQISRQGRAAWVHILVATHHPTVAVLSDAVLKMTLVGRIGLRVMGYKASEVVFSGPTPRADYLQGKGDSYVAMPSGIQRVQWAYFTENELAHMSGAEPELLDWPDWDGNLNQDRRFTGAEIGAAMAHVDGGGGRDTLKRFLAEQGLAAPGSGRAGELLKVGKEALGKLNDLGYSLCKE